jgi:DNA primase
MSEFWQAEARFDWEAYVAERGGMRALRGRRDEYLLTCPECSKPKLAVNVRRRAWRCFTCDDAGRDAASLVAKIEQLMWKDAIAVVLTGHHKPIGSIDKVESRLEQGAERPRSWVPRARPWPDSFEPVGNHSAAGRAGLAYCHERGIPEYVAQAMVLGVCSRGRFRNRLVFPVFDNAGRLVFYQGRAMWKPKAYERHIKTLSPRLDDDGELAGAGDVLLNLSYLVREGIDSALVTEGPIDCAHGWPDVVASWGKHLSDRQIELLMRAGIKNLDLCYDQDPVKCAPDGRILPGGSDAMGKLAPLLGDLFTVRVVRLPAGKDPGNLSKDEIERYRAQATSWGTGERLNKVRTTL